MREPELVRDILYACQGIDGQFLTYEQYRTKGGGFALNDKQAGTSGADRVLVLKLAELGWLYRKLRQAVQDDASMQGSVRRALQAALGNELNDFYRLMAVLEQQAAQPLPTPGSDASSTPYLTLRRLALWLSEPLKRLRLLAAMVDSTLDLKGGALAGAVYAHTQHGAPFQRRYLGKVLSQVCLPCS